MSTSLYPNHAMNMEEWEKQGHSQGPTAQGDDDDDDSRDSPGWARVATSPNYHAPQYGQPYNIPVMQDSGEQMLPYPSFEARRRDPYARDDRLYTSVVHSGIKSEDTEDEEERKPPAVDQSPPLSDSLDPEPHSHYPYPSYYDSAHTDHLMQPLPLNDVAWSPEPHYQPEPRFPPPSQNRFVAAARHSPPRPVPPPPPPPPQYHHSSHHHNRHIEPHHQQQHRPSTRQNLHDTSARRQHRAPSDNNSNPSPAPSSVVASTAPSPQRSSTQQRQPAAQQRVPSQEELAQASTPRAIQALQTWYVRFNELIEYKEIYGDCSVPQKYEVNPQLGIWVNKQRMEKKFMDEGKRSSMTDAKVRNLETVGFKWAKRKGQISWDIKYRELCEYYRRHHNCDVPTKFKDNQALGRWVSTQRSEYKKFQEGRSKHMTREKVELLDRLNFKWEMLNTNQLPGLNPLRVHSSSDSE